MSATVAWVLNMSADLELADPEGFTASTRQSALVAIVGQQFLAAAAAAAPGAVQHVSVAAALEVDAPVVCQAWCPTPRAHTAARASGLQLGPSPPLEVLRAGNHRAFTARLGYSLPRARFVETMAELDAVLADVPPSRGWLLKRPFGFSGRGRKHVAGPLRDAKARRWAAASMVEYGRGLQVEPCVTIDAEFARHGYLTRDGSCLKGEPTQTVCTADGAWEKSEPAGGQLGAAEALALDRALDRVAESLAAIGYFGPFAIDAFRFVDDDGGLHFHPVSEINARYTMGFFTGLGDRQGEWLHQLGVPGAD